MMLRRDIASGGRLVALAGLALAGPGLAVAPGPAAAQGPAGSAQADEPYEAPRTPWGHPDLQGFWSNQTYTPLERREGVEGAFYTPEELAAIESGAASRESAQTEPGTIPDVHYDFTQFGLDRSQAARARNLRTSMIIDPPDGRLPPLNAAGERTAAERAEAQARLGGRWDSAEANQLDDRCIMMRGVGPPMMPSGYNANYHIVQAADHVMILSEMIHDARIIPLDEPAAPPAAVRQWIGLSRGRWEGGTLVVETTNFNGKNPFRGSGDRMRVTERFTRVSDDVIEYRFTVDDPGTWDRPWTAENLMQRTRGPLFEFACHEGNYGLYNTLVGARREERLAAEEAERSGGR